jgi:transcription-repair coupling factor (superfamily II helicase)
LVILTADEEKAERFYQELLFFLEPGQKVALYPGWDLQPYERISPQAEVTGQRWKVRQQLISDFNRGFVVASLRAILQRVPPRQIHSQRSFSLSPEQEFGREELINRLEGMGYIRSTLVTEMGEFAVRGHLVDIFPPSTPDPLRVEFIGDIVDSLRLFDPENQRSSGSLEEAQILPVKEILFFPEFIRLAGEKLL